MTADLAARAELFRALHRRPEGFVVANPWDVGSARILAGLGFPALATSSAGLAFSQGLRDGAIGRAAALDHARAVCAAVDLPVSADLENGYGDAPETAAETIRLAGAVGLVGASIEDATGDPARPIYDLALAVERVAAAVEAARALPFPFVLTARAESFLFGRPDLDDTIRRLQAFEAAGADVLYAPGLPDLASIRAVCGAVGRPVNVIVTAALARHSLAEIAAAGAARISLGSVLARHVLGRLIAAATALRERGDLTFAAETASFAELDRFMRCSEGRLGDRG